MDEIETIKAIVESFAKLSAEECGRVLAWANSKYGNGFVPAAAPAKPDDPGGQSSFGTDVKKGSTAKSAAPSKTKTTKKAKTFISMDKTLNLSPSGKKSAALFAGEKAPANVKQKSVVAVYYLRDILEVEAVSTSGVYTFFKTLSWPVPADLKNTLQQAGTEGWLDTADSDNIKLTSMGENLVEHQLPPKAKG